ncbi:protein disulfide isomerase PDI1 [Lachancea thermotolerans CBS 6340]|uniref:Protein disulfide-isomerase n=1 Tax=Lachancea thermotolerans (strain ATCC 56472 / CBS 6340 / NRRL Y-8284) TaxID=559295 RepID=C5DK19_LACTC|nr:KLTH0F01100p [Lachancea thermotolerans CBS 6340]CAR23820.1 KLTH0F01100p [Lachancea thermotolerans CBS 6340]
MQLSRNLFLGISALAAALGNAQQEATAPEGSAVVKLTSENFADFIKEHPLVLAEFYAPWCGHCKTLAPHYVEAAATLESKNIPLAQVDCTTEEELCMEHGIRGYPTIKVFRNHQVDAPSDYQGGRTASAIVSYMISQSLPPVSILEGEEAADDFKDLLAESSGAVIVDGGVEGLNETFHELAELFRDDFTFVQYNGSDAKQKLSVYLPKQDAPIVFEGKNASISHLVDWVQVETKPYFGDINGETFQSYMDSNVPLAYFFYTSPEERASYEDFFSKLGKEHRGKINFVGLDASAFGRHAQNLNMKEQFPLFVIHDTVSNLKYGLPQLSEEEFSSLTKPLELKTKDIAKFIKSFISGKVEPIIKSEEIPEKQESSVFRIVGKTHEDIINDETRDVLVKYYAPWCGHCKRLAPVYEELANVYVTDKDAQDKVLVANVDATLNDVNVDLEGYPTLILYPAGNKSTPVVYQGARDMESLMNFIQENGHHEINGTAILESKKAQEAKEADEEAEAIEEESVEHDEL